METLTPELADEAALMLSLTRDLATGSIVSEITPLVASYIAGSVPSDAPYWLRVAAAESAMPDGSHCWAVARAHLANRTMARLAYAVHPETSEGLKDVTNGATCHALAKALHIDLYAYAAEPWQSVGFETTAQEAA